MLAKTESILLCDEMIEAVSQNGFTHLLQTIASAAEESDNDVIYDNPINLKEKIVDFIRRHTMMELMIIFNEVIEGHHVASLLSQ